jgi:YqaJ viral recombinase family.
VKTLNEISKRYDLFERRYGIAIADAQQGSEMWQILKLGVISASNVSKVVAKKGSETRNTYMANLVAQICTGVFEEINSKYLEWGNFHEDAARSYYEFSTGNVVKELPFVFKDDTFRTGCSPDGIVSESRGVEIKCPYNATNFIQFLVDDKIKPEYVWQYQFSLWVMNAESWDFVQYHPSMKKTR